MRSWLLVAAALCALITLKGCLAQQFDDSDMGMDKRAAMRNALVRLGRSAGMRNALVRFGKRSPYVLNEFALEEKRNSSPEPFVRFGKRSLDVLNEYALEEKRNGSPEPFVRFGKRSGSSSASNLHDLLDLLQKLDTTNNA